MKVKLSGLTQDTIHFQIFELNKENVMCVLLGVHLWILEWKQSSAVKATERQYHVAAFEQFASHHHEKRCVQITTDFPQVVHLLTSALAITRLHSKKCSIPWNARIATV